MAKPEEVQVLPLRRDLLLKLVELGNEQHAQLLHLRSIEDRLPGEVTMTMKTDEWPLKPPLSVSDLVTSIARFTRAISLSIREIDKFVGRDE